MIHQKSPLCIAESVHGLRHAPRVQEMSRTCISGARQSTGLRTAGRQVAARAE